MKNFKLAWAISSTMLMYVDLVHGSEQSIYDFLWLDPDKKVFVLQEKLYPREGKAYVEGGLGKTTNSDFQESKNYVLKVGYNFHEEWGVEVYHAKYNHKPNDAYNNLKTVNTSYPFIRRLNQAVGVMGTWTPFYGKINTFNKIIYFDWTFGAGVARIDTEHNTNTFQSRSATNTYQKSSYNAAVLKTGVKVHLTKKMHLSLEMLNHHYKAPDPINSGKKELNTNTDAILSVGFTF